MAVPAQLFPFMVLAVLITVAPGPDMALGLRNSLRGGSSAMWWTGLGCCSGLLVHATASVIGLSALLTASAVAYTAVKIAGAVYLVWLGATTLWKSWRDRAEPNEVAELTATVSGITRRSAFRQGMISNLLNPKIAIMFLTLLPQFVSPGEPRVATTAALALSFLAVGLAWWRLTSLLVGGFRRFLTRQRVRVVLERLTGTVMVALGLRVAAGP